MTSVSSVAAKESPAQESWITFGRSTHSSSLLKPAFFFSLAGYKCSFTRSSVVYWKWTNSSWRVRSDARTMKARVTLWFTTSCVPRGSNYLLWIYVGPYVVKIHDSFVRMFFSAAELNEGRPAHGSLPLRDEWSLYVVDRQVWNGKKQYWSSHRYNFSYYIIWAIYVEDFHSTPTFLILQGLRCAINMQV